MAASSRGHPSRRGRPPPPPPPPRKKKKSQQKRPLWRRIVRGTFLWGLAFAMLGAIFLGTAVYMTARDLPGFEQLKSSQQGQMIVVRAMDGAEIVSLGPSYGKWIAYQDIPRVMKDAMVAVEDRRFESHFGVDPIGIARSKCRVCVCMASSNRPGFWTNSTRPW